jgi:hypothetical protein
MTVENAAAGHHALLVGLRWCSLGIALAIGCFIIAHRFLLRTGQRAGQG